MKSRILSAALSGASFFALQSTAFAGQAPATNPNAIPEQVVITASPFAQSNLDIAASVSQLPREVLITNGGFGIGDALKQVPGVTTTGFSTGANRPVIRGLSSTRVKVTENGLGGHDTSDVGDDHGVPIDALASLQVEVLRGPATLRYGSQAIGGVVNAINNRIPIDIGEGTNVEGLGELSSNGTERVGGALMDYRQGNWAVHGDGLVRGSDDYDTPLGKQINSFAFGHGYALGGAYIGDDDSAAGLGFNQYISHYGAPFEPGSASKGHTYLDTKSYNGAGRWEAPLPGITSLNAQGGYTDYFHNEVDDIEGIVAHVTNKEWEGRLEALHAPLGPITNGAFGFQYDNRDFAVTGPESDYLHPTKTRSPALYIFEEVGVTGQLSLQGAARVEWSSVKGDTDALGFFNRNFTPVSFAGGAIFKPMQDTSLFVNVSHVERAPNPVELFAQGAHDTSKTFEFGDPNLGLEKAFSVEGGVKYQNMDGSTASLSIYRSRYNGFIDGFLTGNTRDADGTFHPDDTGEFKELFYRQNDATFWGFEAQAHWHVGDIGMGRWGIDAQADYVRATLDNFGNVPRIPPLRYGGGLFYESTDFALRASILRVSKQNKIEAHETPTAGYTTVDASATFHVYRGDEGDVDIALVGTNLTDSVQRNHISFVKDFWLQPGRTFRVVLHYMR
jgi:iron complex outermembrane receptor protein